MKRFQFRLEKILDLRRLEEAEARRDVARTLRVLDEAEARRDAVLGRIETELRRIVERMSRQMLSPEEAVRSAEYRTSLEAALRAARAEVAAATREATAAGQRLRERHAAHEALRRLRAREEAEHRAGVRRDEQADLDEVAGRRRR